MHEGPASQDPAGSDDERGGPAAGQPPPAPPAGPTWTPPSSPGSAWTPVSAWLPPGVPPPVRVSRRRRAAAAALVVLLLVGLVPFAVLRLPSGLPQAVTPPPPGHSAGVVRVAGWQPTTYDPALQGDAGTAALLAQLFEGLTTFDSSLTVRPALAQSWSVTAGGLQVSFRLRPDLAFSDGSPITASDVVSSWLRVLDPRRQAPLASLLDDVVGAVAYRLGSGPRSGVGIAAQGDAVVVHLVKPADYFPAVAANPALAVVPPSEATSLDTARVPADFTGSGAYVVAGEDGSSITLHANARYWAGAPPIGTVIVVTDFGGRSPVDAFTAGTVDYVPVDEADALWLRYDRQLGPQLREEPSLTVTYYGFDIRRAPFDDVRVRQAFAWAVDWRRIALLADGPGSVATSIVPPGIPGRSTGDYLPRFDPAAARAQLAAAGFPGGRGLPPITMVTSGTAYDEAVVEQLRQNLGVTVTLEMTPADEYAQRLVTDTPDIWSMSWIADYPAQEDFLGILLRSTATSNYGGWNDPQFDADLDRAGAAGNPAAQAAAYAAAQAIVRDQVPVVPVSYAAAGAHGSASWALSRTGLLGATTSAIGIPRFAGLAWAP